MTKPLSWLGVARLGLVQLALGAVAALTTSTLNRIMVVEAAMPAALPAGFIAWHYLVQLSRPKWGHGADGGGKRAPFIIGGMGVLVLGSLIATDAALMLRGAPLPGVLAGVFAYTLVGAGVGACGTSLLALLAARVAPERRAPAAALAWVLMILGIVLSAGVLSVCLKPFSPQRLALTASGIGAGAFFLTLVGVHRIEAETAVAAPRAPRLPFRASLEETLADPLARRFTLFIFISMLAYSAQELVLEPFAGLVFHLPPAGSAQISATMHAGALLGMILVGVLGARAGAARAWMRFWIFAGCAGSAAALVLMAFAGLAGTAGPPLPLLAAGLGLANGVFTVAAVGSMMGLAGASGGREGVRVGVWGAAQAGAFALGGFLGAVGVDLLRETLRQAPLAFAVVFLLEAGLFLSSAVLALRLDAPERQPKILPNLSLGSARR